ncbi:MAG: DEAD/DEAH box helicase family protein [Bacteroidota bacterium]
MDKKALSERDICTKYITPAIDAAGWDVHTQVREEVSFTDGRIIQRGNMHARGKRKRADYLLYYRANLPLAIVEAKDNSHPVGSGMQQALEYADILDIPFVYTSNGDAFLEHDRTGQGDVIEREIALDAFPSPDELWARYRQWKGLSDDAVEVVLQDYYMDADGKTPRYYQRVAINRTVEAIAQGQDRVLLVMATGTGKTFTAFQIIWRLWKSRRKKRVLFLADRNILVDQAMQNDFRPLGDGMTKIRHREADKSYEIYLALYQALTGPEAQQNIFRAFSPDFFDLIIVDECHRGSAAEDSAWRVILEYFSSASQIGLTATPKETRDVSNIDYFGEAVYTYSLKQGIEDGFLAPYRVIRVGLDRDLEGWRPTKGHRDKYGEEIEDRVYNLKDYDRTLVIEERTKAVAQRITDFLKGTADRFAKTIVFCVDTEHAERMRQALVNANADLVRKHPYYVVRITGDDDVGKRELSSFIDPESRFPVIATTSKLLTTGVDAQTCKLIVLDANIGSMTEFKQIIGRGTRIREDYGKVAFSILDFRKNTDKFTDPDFDGEPVQVYVVTGDDDIVPPDVDEPTDEAEEPLRPTRPADPTDDVAWDPDAPPQRRSKVYVNGVPVRVVNERVQYYGPGGKLITESLRDYTRRTVREHFASLDDFLQRWNAAEQKAAVVEELREQGLFLEELRAEVGKDLDPFDLVCHVAFDQPPLTRRERALEVRKRDVFTTYGPQARAVLDALLDKYADEGIEDIEDLTVLKLDPLRQLGAPLELLRSFGGKPQYVAAVRSLEAELYRAA